MRYAEPMKGRVLREEKEVEIGTRRVATIVESV